MKNRVINRYVLFIATTSCLLVAFACQKGQLPEYRAYKDDADVPRISVQDAKKDVDAGIAVIVDGRGDASYKVEHITGSLNLAPGTSDNPYPGVPKDKKIIVYCS